MERCRIRMKRGAFIVGLAMLVTGGYLLWWSFQLLFTTTFFDYGILGMLALYSGIILPVVSLGVMLWAYISPNQALYRQIAKQKQWQVIQVPLKCAECGNAISIRSLEWIGEEEVRCPFCSKDLEIRRS